MGTTPQLMTFLVWRDEPGAPLVSTQAALNWRYVCQQEEGTEIGRKEGGREEDERRERQERGGGREG